MQKSLQRVGFIAQDSHNYSYYYLQTGLPFTQTEAVLILFFLLFLLLSSFSSSFIPSFIFFPSFLLLL